MKPEEKSETASLEEILLRYDRNSEFLVPILQDLQTECGYLPQEELREIATKLDIPLSRVFSVAAYYPAFRLAPKAEHEVTLCMGTMCHLKGAADIAQAICQQYDIEPGGTTADRLFTLQAVNCVGACELAPVMIVDEKYFDGVTEASALEIIQALSESRP